MNWLNEVFNKQLLLQKNLGRDVPSTVEMYNAATAAMVEIGEMLQCDKRWKRAVHHMSRPTPCDIEKFTEELADAFIYLFNVAIYEGIDAEDLKTAIDAKILKNYARLLHGGNND